MKYFAMCLFLLGLGLFTLGCQEASTTTAPESMGEHEEMATSGEHEEAAGTATDMAAPADAPATDGTPSADVPPADVPADVPATAPQN